MLEVIDGIIYTHGEYYLEPAYVPYYAERLLSGIKPNYNERDTDGDIWSVFKVSDQERAAYPALEKVATVAVRRDMEHGVWLSWIRSCSYQKTK